MAWSQSGNIRGASGVPGASGASGLQGASGASGGTGGTGGIGATGPAGTTTWAGITDKPGAILNYKGTWNASTNSPTLSDSTGSGGDVYRVSVGGTRNLGSGSIVWDVSDYAIYSPVTSSWEKADTTDAVSSVNTRTGAITLSYLDLGASGTPSASNFLRGDGSWAAGPIGATGAMGASGSTGGTGGLGASGPGFFRDIATITAATTLGASGNTDYVRILGATGTIQDLLLHFDGASGSTTFSDSGGTSKSVTRVSNAIISTAQSKFGGSSLLTNSTALRVSSNASFGFGTGDFTIDFWLYYTGGNGYVFFFNATSGSGNYVSYGLNTGTKTPFVWNDTNILVGNTNITNDTWQHHAVVRNSNTLTIYLNGSSIGSTTWNADLGTTRPLAIGDNGGGAQVTAGYFDEFRVLKGTAAYTANFTAPSAPYSDPTTGTPTLPAAATANTNKSFYYFRNITASPIIIGASGSQAINGATGGLSLASNGTAHLVSDGTGWYSL